MRNLLKLKKNNLPAGNEAKLIVGGRIFFEMLETLINNAGEHIYFQTYIFLNDITGKQIQQALIRAAKRKVQIFLLLDAYGSSSLPKEFIKEMTDAGIQFRFFGPLFSGRGIHLSRRMHHKIFVADGTHALVGGINISDHYNELPGSPAWLDFAVLCKGPVALDLFLICHRKWNRKRIRKIPQNILKIFQKKYHEPENGCHIYARQNDPLLNKTEVSSCYKKAFRWAEDEIIIAGGYFIPGYIFRKLMKRATRRGVKIKIITGSKTDVYLSKYARQFLYDWLLRNKIEIYEYRETVVHAKVAVVDKQWATIGSYDLNNLSAYSNIELNVDILNQPFAENLFHVLTKIIKESCDKIEPDMLMKKYGMFRQLKAWTSYRIVRFFFWITQVLSVRKSF